jgi:hydroxyacylglutathione hydrolase
MNIEQIKVGFMEVFCYLLSCPRTKEALFIDPAGNEEELVDHVQEQGLVSNTLLTPTVMRIIRAATRR